jgi:hypothetical protein
VRERKNLMRERERERNCEPEPNPGETTLFHRKGERWRPRTKSAADQSLERQALRTKRCPERLFRDLRTEEQKAPSEGRWKLLPRVRLNGCTG